MNIYDPRNWRDPKPMKQPIVPTDPARAAVLWQLDAAIQHLMLAEEAHRAKDPDAANDIHAIILSMLRARAVEDTDPDPIDRVVHCLQCAAAYAAGGT